MLNISFSNGYSVGNGLDFNPERPVMPFRLFPHGLKPAENAHAPPAFKHLVGQI
jgi:hypothetical protein